ncbi:hypothetical protein V3481_004864 [Fusarium oxysporum f. sp. vasinfectum]
MLLDYLVTIPQRPARTDKYFDTGIFSRLDDNAISLATITVCVFFEDQIGRGHSGNPGFTSSEQPHINEQLFSLSFLQKLPSIKASSRSVYVMRIPRKDRPKNSWVKV